MMLFLDAEANPQAKVLIVGCPFDAASSYRRGSRFAPTAIRRASQSIESCSAIFKADLRDVDLGDVGDLALSEQPETMVQKVADAVHRFAAQGSKLVVLGGDHSVAIGVVQGLVRHYGRELQVAVLDAHSDWRDSYEGSRFNHACTVRRLAELTNKVVVAGTRSFFGEEDFSRYIPLHELPNFLISQFPLYLSLDLDVLDASVCPGVGNPEPGGASYWEVIEVFKALRGFNIVGFDVVELCPPYDPSEISAITAAKLVQEGICAFFQNCTRDSTS